MTTSIRTVEHFDTIAMDRNGAEFMSHRTSVEFWTNAQGTSQQGKALAQVLRTLKLAKRIVQPLHVEQAYNAKGDACGFLMVATVA